MNNREDIEQYIRQFEIYIPEKYRLKFGEWDKFKEQIDELIADSVEVDEMQQNGWKTNQEIQDLKDEIEELKSDIDDVISDLKDIDIQTNMTEDEAENASKELDNCVKELEALT